MAQRSGRARAAAVRRVAARLRRRALGRRRSRRPPRSACSLLLSPVGGEPDPGPVRDRRRHLDHGHRLPVGRSAARPLARANWRPSSTPPGVSSPSRRCSRSGAGSPATSTTSSGTDWPPSCCRSPAPGTCCTAIPRPPRRRCGRPRTWAGAACGSCGARSRCCAATTRRRWRRRSRRRRRSAHSSTMRGPEASPSSCATRGDLARIAPGVGVALYRIAQEALANAARHAPRARTVLDLEVADGRRHARRRDASGRRSPVGRRAGASRATAWSGCASGRPRSAASSPPGRRPRAGG